MLTRPDQLKDSIDQELLVTFDGDADEVWIKNITIFFPVSKIEIELEGKIFEAYLREFGENLVQEFWDWQRGRN